MAGPYTGRSIEQLRAYLGAEWLFLRNSLKDFSGNGDDLVQDSNSGFMDPGPYQGRALDLPSIVVDQISIGLGMADLSCPPGEDEAFTFEYLGVPARSAVLNNTSFLVEDGGAGISLLDDEADQQVRVNFGAAQTSTAGQVAWYRGAPLHLTVTRAAGAAGTTSVYSNGVLLQGLSAVDAGQDAWSKNTLLFSDDSASPCCGNHFLVRIYNDLAVTASEARELFGRASRLLAGHKIPIPYDGRAQ